MADSPENALVITNTLHDSVNAPAQDLMQLAEILANASLVPDRWRGKVADVYLAAETARELGVPIVYVFQNAYAISWRLAWYAKGLAGLASRHRRWLVEPMWRTKHPGTPNMLVDCAAVRRTGMPVYARITWAEATAYGWTNKNSDPWKASPEHMMHWRALGRLLSLYEPTISSFGSVLEELPLDQLATLISSGGLDQQQPDDTTFDSPAHDGNRQTTLTALQPDVQALIMARSPAYIIMDAQIRQNLPGWNLWKFDTRRKQAGLAALSELPEAAGFKWLAEF